MNRVSQLSRWATMNVIGLVVTAAGMVLQIASGSELYPSLTGPIVLLVAATFVVLGPRRLTPYVAVLIPLALGAGVVVAAVMTGGFTNQLADPANAGVLLGSLMHVVGLVTAVAGGVGMLLDRRGLVSVAP